MLFDYPALCQKYSIKTHAPLLFHIWKTSSLDIPKVQFQKLIFKTMDLYQFYQQSVKGSKCQGQL